MSGLKQCEYALWIWIYLWLFLAPYVAVLESKAPRSYALHLGSGTINHAVTVMHQTLRKWLTDLHTLFSPSLSWLLGASQIPLSPSKVIAIRCPVITQIYSICKLRFCSASALLQREYHSSTQLLAGSAAFFSDEVTPYSSELVTLVYRLWSSQMLVWNAAPLRLVMA